MDVQQFTEDPQVIHAIDDIEKKIIKKNVIISDIVDNDGHQYVDLVMEGGGVLGMALVGYTYALESAGIRVLSVGGTSAGAINAMVTAAADVPAEARSERVLQLVAEMDMFSFVDGKDDDDDDAQDFVKAMLRKSGFGKMLWKGMQIRDNIDEQLGINRGDAFHKWMKRALQQFGIRTVADLEKRMRTLPSSLKHRDTGQKLTFRKTNHRLAIVAADVSTETKVVFPEMAEVYYKKPQEAHPGDFVRASMSIPLFFAPFLLKNQPTGKDAILKRRKHTGYTGSIPKETVFIDGGIMSNFPINLFHSEKNLMPTRPTFGAKLGVDRTKPQDTSSAMKLIGSIFNAARHASDYDFIARNPDFRQLVTYIDTGDHNWLDFFLSEDAKIDLFRRGVVAARDFLLGFDWEAYKAIRQPAE